MMVRPPIDVGDQRPCIQAREVAAHWARLDDVTLLDRLSILGKVERDLVVEALADLGIQIGAGR
jgi:hypothetical protein